MKKSENMTLPEPPQIIFLLGIRHRSGTNIVQEVIARHPQCTSHSEPEDFLISGLDYLTKYIDHIKNRRKSKRSKNDFSTDLRIGLRSAIQRHIADMEFEYQTPEDSSQTIITKSPSVEGLLHFRTFFPDSHLILLVRDGRSVIESAMRSFGADFVKSCKRYQQAADTILEFIRSDENPDRTLLIRYEDFLSEPEEFIHSILTFLELDPAIYPFEELGDLPVIGSSDLTSDGRAEIHWNPISKHSSFDPSNRFQDWTDYQKEQFDWIAGQELENLGYSRHVINLSFAKTISYHLRSIDIHAVLKRFAKLIRT